MREREKGRGRKGKGREREGNWVAKRGGGVGEKQTFLPSRKYELRREIRSQPTVW